MINHARCLLMNVNGAAAIPVDVPGEEIIDPAFSALNLPTYLDTVRRLLFGANPDRWFLNYRCTQLLTIAHATPLEEYLLAFDTRITYEWRGRGLAEETVFAPAITRLAGTTTAALSLSGVAIPPDETGQMRQQFRVSTTTTTTGQVKRLTTPLQNTVFEFTPTSRQVLTGSGLKFRLHEATDGQDWLIQLLVRPARDLSAVIESLTKIGEPALLSLFGITKEEPYQTFRELWFRKQELPLKLAALVCAVVYRSEEVRLGQ